MPAHATGLTASLSHDPADLERLRDDWSALMARGSTGGVFVTWEWVSAYWRHAHGQARLWLVQVRDADGQLVGIAPLMLNWHHPLPYAGFGLRMLAWRQLEFIGMAAAADHLDFVLARGREPEILQAILALIWRHRFEWDVLHFAGLAQESLTLDLLRATGWPWEQPATSVCPVVKLPGNWETYLTTLSRGKRKEQRRFIRQLDEAYPGRWRWCVADDPASVSATLTALMAFHQAKWESRNRPGAFAEAAMAAFHHEATQQLHERGWLRLYRLEIDGELAAALYTIWYDGRVYDFASGLNMAYADFSPGQVLTEMSLRAAVEAGMRYYDFLRGDEEYKFRWGAEPALDYTLHWIASPQARGLQLAFRVLRWTWRMIKRVLPHDLRRRIRARARAA